VEEGQHGLVASLVLLADLGVVQVASSGHEAMDLGGEGLDVVGDLQVGLEGIDIGGHLVLGGKHGHGDVHLLGVIGIDHGRVALHGGLEGLVILAGGQTGDLAAPAVAEDGPGLEAAAGGEVVGLGHDAGDLGQGIGRGGLGLEEVAELLLVLVGGRGVPGDVGGAALEEVGHDDAVLLLVGGGEDVGALDGLVEEAEDV
jgi:hypothetical protein